MHDASLFELRPSLVIRPENTDDLSEVVRFVNEHKEHNPKLSITARSGGTDMSGGAINESLVLDMTYGFDAIGKVEDGQIDVQPGAYYRDFEPVTLASGLLMPSYPASRELCTVGGMAANNAGGEKSLVYGKTDKYIKQLRVVLRDGNEYTIKPLSGAELKEKLNENNLSGRLYKQVYNLLRSNRQAINKSRPKVSKNSTGYNIWDAWDGRTLDLTKLFVGSQGTLGLITDIKFSLVPAKPLSGMVVAFFPDMSKLGDVINATLPLKPTSLESFDEHTLKFAIRFFLSFRKTLGFKRFALLGLSFIPLLNKLLRYLPNLPKLIMLIEFEGDEQAQIDVKIAEVETRLAKFDIETHVAADKKHEEKFWIMRRESFNLLRKNVKKKHTAPFIDDLIVPPKHLPDFLPSLYKILEKYEFLYTVAGHMGDGNFHIIPLMDLADANERSKIEPALKEVIKLVVEYDGSLSGEHNDGMIRGPFLKEMFDGKTLDIQHNIKHIFDPDNIFNPHKKTTADWEFSLHHMRRKF
jgi:FAD/FMN-containing dehydrogenase